MEDNSSFISEVENLFGTDKALGISFHTEAGENITLEQLDSMQVKPDGYSIFLDGSYAVCCTNYAIQIYRRLPQRVQIFGFANDDNPTSKVARDGIHPGGHDFAIVNERFLIDPWIRLVFGLSGPIVFDMHDEKDLITVTDMYGPKSCWRHMKETEDYDRYENKKYY